MQPRECHTDANANADANRIRTKNNKSPSPWVGDTNMARIGFIASEEICLKMMTMTDDGRWMPAYTISSPMSLWLRRANNVDVCSQMSWYTHYFTIYISVIHFLHSTHLHIFSWNDFIYSSTNAVYITMVTRNQRNCNLSGSSLKIIVYTTNKKWKNTLLNRYYCWKTLSE